MQSLNWDERYVLKDQKMNVSHEFIIQKIVELEETAKENDFAKMRNSLNLFYWYMAEHFRLEEEFMMQIKYPKVKNEIKLHEKFLKRFEELSAIFKEDTWNSLKVKEFFNYIKSFMQIHIKVNDKDLLEYVRLSKRFELAVN